MKKAGMGAAKTPAKKGAPAMPSAKPAAGAAKPAAAAEAPAKQEKKQETVRTEPIAARLPYPGGFPVYLARYVLFGGNRPRAAMRFFNASDILITGIRFRLTEKDGEGKVINEYPLERTKVFAESGGEFEVADAAVGAECVSLEARVESVISDGYEYIVEEDGVRLVYGSREPERKFFFKEKPSASVSKRRKRYVLLAFLTVFGFALVAGALVWQLDIINKATSARTETYTVKEIPEYVEA